MEKKFKRCMNFSAKEEHALITLVHKYKGIIECRKSDSYTINEKKRAWEILAGEFNSSVGDVPRDVAALKNKYENLKKRSKKKFSDEKTFLKGTGGGPSTQFQIDETDLKIKEIITTQVTGFPSQYGADRVNDSTQEGLRLNTNELLTLEERFMDEIESINVEQSNNDKENTSPQQPRFIKLSTIDLKKVVPVDKNLVSVVDWSKCTPAKLRTPLSTPLKKGVNRLKRNNFLQSQLGAWALSKANLTDRQTQQHEEEHQLKLQHMQEKHNLEMEILLLKKKKMLCNCVCDDSISS